MKTTITFRHMKPSPTIKEYATDKLLRLERYAPNAMEAHVILSVEKKFHAAEVVVSAKGVRARGKAETGDMYSSIEGALEKVEKTLKRFHDKKITSKHHPNRAPVLA